ncbi:MAG: PP2C family protein-serine/threonine phosphatase [Microbacteriaceae bacterium]
MGNESRTVELLAVKRAMDLIGTGPEDRFDRVVSLIARYFGLPIGMISMVNGEKIWYKSRIGFDAEESAFHGSFTEIVVNTGEPHAVGNALDDERVRHSPWTDGTLDRIIAYIGYPLRSSDGTVIGCIALMDRQAREFTTDHLVQLGLVGLWMQDEMTRETEQDRARQVQEALMPSQEITLKGCELVGSSVPAKTVSGDFFDWRKTADGAIFSLADVMGKGVGSAIIAAATRAILRTSDDAAGVDVAVARASAALDDDLSASGSFTTLFYGRLVKPEFRVDYVDAGHGLALHVHADGSWDRLAHSDLPLGAGADSSWSQHSIYLEPGESVVAFSDGVLDLFDGSLKSMASVAEVFAQSVTAEMAVEMLSERAKSMNGIDDVTIVALRRLPD